MPALKWKRPLPERRALISFALGAASWGILASIFLVPWLYFSRYRPDSELSWVARFVATFGIDPMMAAAALIAGGAIIVGLSGRPYYRSSMLAAFGATLGTLLLVFLGSVLAVQRFGW